MTTYCHTLQNTTTYCEMVRGTATYYRVLRIEVGDEFYLISGVLGPERAARCQQKRRRGPSTRTGKDPTSN